MSDEVKAPPVAKKPVVVLKKFKALVRHCPLSGEVEVEAVDAADALKKVQALTSARVADVDLQVV